MTLRAPHGAVRVLIADRDSERPPVREALEESELVMVCSEAATAEDALRQAEHEQPDVCLVGWDIPGGGLPVLRRMHVLAPLSAVVVLAEREDADDLLATLRAGAVGYLPGATSSEGLRRVVRAVVAREAAVPRSMVGELVLELRASMLERDVTHRKAQVLEMLRQGSTTAQIASRLHLSPVTVRRHISELMHQLEVADRSGLLQSAGGPAFNHLSGR